MKPLKNYPLQTILLATACAVLPLSALADTVGTYQIYDKQQKPVSTMSISYKDDQHIRMETGHDAYMLITGDKVYAVSTHNGKMMAIDMTTMPKMNMPAQQPKPQGKVTMTKTGRTEVIAGLTGDVYEIVVERDDATNKPEKMEFVLSADKRAAVLSKAFMAMAKRMGEHMGADQSARINDQIMQAQKQGYSGGLLRSGHQLVLQSVKDISIPGSSYELPPGVTPTQMPAMGGMPGAGGAPGMGGPGMQQMDPATMQKMREAMQKMMQQQQQKH